MQHRLTTDIWSKYAALEVHGRFLTLWTRREMLAEINDEALRGKRVA